MDSENQKINVDLVGKFLAGEASPEEAMLVDEWLADPANKKEFHQYVKLWKLAAASKTPKVPSGQEAWSDLQNALHISQKRMHLRRLIPIGIAASVVALILVGYFLFQKETTNGSGHDLDIVTMKKEATGEKITDTLKDGSIITINKNSSISYTNQFNVEARELDLRGEAFFQVKPDKAKPFIISTEDLKIEVVGTAFNVRKISSTGDIEVQVQTGIVKMYTSENSLMVKKGQTGIYAKGDRTLRLKDTIDINSIGYATNSFYFNDILLIDACKYLAHAFNVDIKIDPKKFGECRLTAQFDNKSLNYILEVINATFNTNSRKEGNIIHINGNGCQ